MTENRTIDLGNNESLSRGVFRNADGTWTALTFSESKTFKTRAGAERWLYDRARSTWKEPHHTKDPELWWLTNGRLRKTKEQLILARLELGLRWLHDRASRCACGCPKQKYPGCSKCWGNE